MQPNPSSLIHVHLRLDPALDDRLEALRAKHPSLRTRTARIGFALEVGLRALCERELPSQD